MTPVTVIIAWNSIDDALRPLLVPFPPFFHQEEMSSISSRYSVFNCRIALATADS